MFSPLISSVIVAVGVSAAAGPATSPVASGQPEAKLVELLADDFSAYPLAEILDRTTYGSRLGPWQLMTMHYAWHSRRYRGWQQVQLPFRIVDRDGRRFLDQPESFFNVVIKAGDPRWRDYAMELDLAVDDGPAGPIVRYKTSRQNYWVCFRSGQPVKLYRRDQEEHVLRGESTGFKAEKGRLYHCQVTCDGPRLCVAVDGKRLIAIEDDAYSEGQIALRTEGPSRFASVRVRAQAAEVARLSADKKRYYEHVKRITSTLPPAKLVHTAVLPDKPARVVGVHDVNDDGKLEIVAEYLQPTASAAGATRLCVHDWQGKLLWTLDPAPSGSEAPAAAGWRNVADLDGDGRTEIICTCGREILIVEGASGRIKRTASVPTAEAQGSPSEHTINYCYVCNLRGLPGRRDLVVKDEYSNIWAYTDELAPLWHRQLNTGHFLAARDIDGDGKDEVMGGYSMLKPDGTTLWTVPGGDPLRNRFPGPEHVDGLLIDRFGPGPGAPIRVALAASDLGFILLDVEGRILAQHPIGHAQWIAAGRFRPELPGRQMAVGTQWGNHGIINLFDCEGRLITIREMPSARTWPIYWLGQQRPLILFEGWATGFWSPSLDRIFRLPGHMLVPPHALDLNADGLDELLVLEDNRVQVYAPDGVKGSGSLPAVSLTNWHAGSHAR